MIYKCTTYPLKSPSQNRSYHAKIKEKEKQKRKTIRSFDFLHLFNNRKVKTQLFVFLFSFPSSPPLKQHYYFYSPSLSSLVVAWNPKGMIFLVMYTYQAEGCEGPSYERNYYGCEGNTTQDCANWLKREYDQNLGECAPQTEDFIKSTFACVVGPVPPEPYPGSVRWVSYEYGFENCTGKLLL